MATYRLVLPSENQPAKLPPVEQPPPDSLLFPVDHRYRLLCLRFYNEAFAQNPNHILSVRHACRCLKATGHPWHYFEQVYPEINAALGRHRGRLRVSHV